MIEIVTPAASTRSPKANRCFDCVLAHRRDRGSMSIRRLSADTERSIRLSFGAHGDRAVEFLESAADLMEGDSAVSRQPEIVAYCVREALMSVLNTQRPMASGEQWKDLAESAAAAARSVERARGLGADAEAAAAELLAESASRIEALEEDLNTNRKRLIAVLAQRTGSEPGRWADRAVRNYVKIIGQSNVGVHGNASPGAVETLWAEGLQVLETLFTPAEVRHPRLDELAALDFPTERDLAELVSLILAPNHFRRFLSRLTSVSWLSLLEPAGLLDLPVDDSGWDGHVVVDSLGPVDPGEVTKFLRRTWERSDRSFRSANTIAWSLQPSGLLEAQELILELGREHPPTVDLAIMRVDQLDPSDDFVVALARIAFVPEVFDSDTHLDPLIAAYLSGVNEGTWPSRIGALVDLLVTYDEDKHWGYSRDRPGSLADPVESWDGTAHQLAFLLGEVIARSALTADPERMHALLERLPPDTRSRARAFYLARQPDLDLPRARAEIATAIQTRFPTPDDVELADRLGDLHDPIFVDVIRDAFGPQPSVKEVARRLHNNDVPVSWRQRFSWSAFLPTESIKDWRTALEVIAGRFGRPTREALTRPRVEFFEVESPIAVEELSAMSLQNAIETIRAWRPAGRGRGSAMELANAAAHAFRASPETWFADPVRVVSGLRHPTYISAYLRALADSLSTELPVHGDVVSVIELVWAEPWRADELGGDDGWDLEATWLPAQQASLELLKKMADLNLEFSDFDAAWNIVAAASFPVPQPDPAIGDSDSLTRALNRDGPRAFRVALSLLAFEFRANRRLRADHVELLDRALGVRGSIATEYRSLLAIESRLIRGIASEWLDANFDELFVSSIYAQDAIDMAMKFGPADSEVLRRSKRLIRDAVSRDVDRSLDRTVIGMLWGLSGYRVRQTEQFLATTGKLSAAGATLGRLLSNAEAITPLQLSKVVEFWELATTHQPPQSLAGFAWLARSSAISDSDWIRLTRSSLPRWAGSINGLHFVAERIERLPVTAEVLELLGDLVQLRGATWDQRRVVSVAIQILSDHPDLASLTSFQRLEHILRERGVLA